MSQRDEHEDATIVVSHGSHGGYDDATVVSHGSHAGHELDEQLGQLHGAPHEQLDDATVAVGRAPAEDATVVANVGMHGAAIASSTGSGSQAMPVADPDDDIGRVLPNRGGVGLDPLRPIAPAPGMMPWEGLPQGQRGVMQGLPVSYGSRPSTETLRPVGIDEVQRQIGPAPAGHPVTVRPGREALPSLERRDRRSRTMTLIAYGAVIALSVLGLWGVASIAFG